MVIETEWGRSLVTGPDFKCATKACVADYGRAKIVDVTAVEATGTERDWANYAVAWTRGKIAVPSVCGAPHSLTVRGGVFGPLINCACRELGQVPNLRIVRGRETIKFVATRSIGPNTELLTSYGSGFASALRKRRADRGVDHGAGVRGTVADADEPVDEVDSDRDENEPESETMARQARPRSRSRPRPRPRPRPRHPPTRRPSPSPPPRATTHSPRSTARSSRRRTAAAYAVAPADGNVAEDAKRSRSWYVSSNAARGRGLYANMDLLQGCIITQMPPACRIFSARHRDRIERDMERGQRLPHDALITVGREIIVDDALILSDPVESGSEWYLLNHGDPRDPVTNVRMRAVRTPLGKLHTIQFIACRDVPKGQELRFAYGEPDPRWREDKSSSTQLCGQFDRMSIHKKKRSRTRSLPRP